MGITIADIGVYVVGNPGSLRNLELIDIGSNIEFVDPVFVAESEDSTMRQLWLEFSLNGRRLKRGEKGCALAHVNARSLISSSSVREWNLVLEDDVGIPRDWFDKLSAALPTSFEEFTPGVILFNTNPYFDLGPKVVKLSLKPSLTNAYLIHKSVIADRKFTNTEPYELADWPISFCDVDFWAVSGIALDLGHQSTIEYRPLNRLGVFLSLICRTALAPVMALVAGVPLNAYVRWILISPIKRDAALRLRQMRNSRAKSFGA